VAKMHRLWDRHKVDDNTGGILNVHSIPQNNLQHFSCNVNKQYPSLIIFCTYIIKRFDNQKLVYIPTSLE